MPVWCLLNPLTSQTGLTKTRWADGPTGRTMGKTEWPVVPPALPFTTGHLIVGRYFVLRSEDDGPGDGQETGPS